MKLFLTALTQVCLVSMNVVFIANEQVTMMLLTGFCISYVWTLNIRRIAIGSRGDQFIYASGAMVGTGVGYYLSKFLITVI